MVVFVVDKRLRPLMPCSEKRARLLLGRGRAVVHRLAPFTIRLKDRTREKSLLQPLRLKTDPGAKVTGLALLLEKSKNEIDAKNQASLIWGAEIHHKTDIKRRIDKRRVLRRGRRGRKCRYRRPRFRNRPRRKCLVCGGNTPKKPGGGRKNRCRRHTSHPRTARETIPAWIPPSLRAWVDQTFQVVHKLLKVLPVTVLSVEHLKFDTQLLQDSNIQGIEYQQGTLQGYEVKEYLLEKYARTCAYCRGASQDPILEVEHVVPKTPQKGPRGTDRVSNLVIAFKTCNEAKSNSQPDEWLRQLQRSTDSLDQVRAKHVPQAIERLKRPLQAAAFLNSTRWYVFHELQSLGLPVEYSTGALTKCNRARCKLPKCHIFDAACIGSSTPDQLLVSTSYVQVFQALGRGTRQMALVNKSGFPIGYRKRVKRSYGFQTGDLVLAVVPKGKYAGRWTGRVAVRSSGYFDLKGLGGRRLWQGISHKYCRLLQHADGWFLTNYKLPPSSGKTVYSSAS
ncbi:MAG: RNA-guided endonuclease IscB [Candidatus Hermodarchaeota archaeon]